METGAWKKRLPPLIPVLLFALGVIAVLMPFFGWDFSRLPGNIDTAFNGWVLEHGYQWLTGRESSLLNAPFFYPAPLALAYSDIHYGNLPLYALLRLCRIPAAPALGIWIVLQFALNYFVCFTVLKKWKYSQTGASLGALLFSFAMPVTAQLGHIQLLPRYPALCAIACAVAFCRRPATRTWCGLWAAVCWQFAASVYLAVMLCGLLLLALFCKMLLDRSTLPPLREWFGTKRIDRLLRVAALLLAVLIVQKMLAPAAEVWKGLAEFQPLSLAVSVQPHWYDWFRPAGEVFCWHTISPLFPDAPFVNERHLFAGAAALFLFFRALCGKKKNLQLPIIVAVLTALFFTKFGSFTLFSFFREHIPGLAGIRCPVRIILLLLFLPALLLADFWDNAGKKLRWLMLPVLAADLIVAAPVPAYSPAHFQTQVDALKAKLAECPPEKPFFYEYPESEKDGALVAMYAAQQLHLKTVNGYSGHNPPRYFPYGMIPKYRRQSLGFWMGYSQSTYGKDKNLWPHGICIVK